MGTTRDNFNDIQNNMNDTLLLIKDKLVKERMDAFGDGFDKGYDVGYKQALEDIKGESNDN